MNGKLPLWLTLLTTLLVATNLLVFGLFAIVHPELPWPELGDVAAAPIRFFAARHVAFGVVLLHGLVRRDLAVLRVCYTLFFLLAVVDFGLLAVFDYPVPVLQRLTGDLARPAKLALSLGLFVGPMGAATLWLRRNQRAASLG